MIRPIDCAHSNYAIWEQTIDGHLRSHKWSMEPECVVPLTLSTETLAQFVEMYEEAGWIVHYNNEKGEGAQLRFLLPNHFVPRNYDR